jgi:hypothetical protein
MLVDIEVLPISTANISLAEVVGLAVSIEDPESNIPVRRMLRYLYNYYCFKTCPRESRPFT